MAESEDCIEWTERETIVEPDDIDPPQVPPPPPPLPR